MRVIINIDVPNLADGIEFYTQALGLTHTRTLDDDVAELEGVSSTVYLLQKSAGSPASRESGLKRSYARHWTPVHLDFVVDDIDSAKEKALKAGAKCESECVEWMGSRCITFSDPFGHGFCLIEFSGHNYSNTE
ncbi:VOC family protein [Zobellella denitrificans]|jgi:predicted enzyme related to lactoylglutathione lyase|uniref:VOC family protein n=1 Tax=Zobellella denitrificans TaxID=347534 RepID=UPI000BBE258F|nr:VOC family protein [Zobellella denitrificans]